MWATVEQAMARSDRLVIDLTQTTFIDSTGLAVIIRAHRHRGETSEPMVIRSPSAAARKLLSISGVEQLVTIEESQDASS